MSRYCTESQLLVLMWSANRFISQGAELSVLKSIQWDRVKFDVLCVETTPHQRPANYAQEVISYLAPLGYINATGQVGRNICKCTVIPCSTFVYVCC
jgi:hypothetical protein